MKALVTGATGFVGTWLAKHLLELGHDVTILSRSGQSPIQHANLKIAKGDITQVESLIAAAKDHDHIFHLAGLIGYSRSLRSAMHEVNVVGTANVIRACEVNRVPKLFFMSSVTAIGAARNKFDILDENSAYNVTDLDLGYFETKREAEELVLKAHKKGVVQAYLANPSTIYGPGDAEKGSRKTQIKVAQGKMPFYTSGGVGVIHVDDVIQGCMKILEIGKPAERYVLTSENITIKQLFQIIAEEAEVKAPSLYLPNFAVHTLGKIGDWQEKRGKKPVLTSENAWTSTMFHWFKNDKMRRELKMEPRPARAAIKDSVDWMRANGIINK